VGGGRLLSLGALREVDWVAGSRATTKKHPHSMARRTCRTCQGGRGQVLVRLRDFYERPLSIHSDRGFSKAWSLEDHSLDCMAGGSVCIDRALLLRIAPSLCLHGLHARRIPLGARRKSLFQLPWVHLQPAN